MTHTPELPMRLYIGAQNDIRYLVDQPPRPVPADFIGTNHDMKVIAKFYQLAEFGNDAQMEARIAATYNACADIPTEALKADVVKRMEQCLREVRAMAAEQPSERPWPGGGWIPTACGEIVAKIDETLGEK